MTVVLLGATGFTGRLVGRAMFRRGLRPVPAARSEAKLSELAVELEARHGGTVQTAVVDGANPYLFTADMLAWAAERAAAGAVTATGVRGPLEAFELLDLVDGARHAGLKQVG